ncbi:MAG: methylated-DNA--[protein]-cysteine S-methyltransferase [Bacteroidetes bacterium]|jgi:methylated-DNA-[protein]-cysteine S-methyltransferase|nr:methylated-DNA--[protein]-cysteine S-methyltransferase [Bacteroidota bacterium]
MKPLTSFIKTPLGIIEMVSEGDDLVKAEFNDKYKGADVVEGKIAEKVCEELREYFEGKRKKFTVKLKPAGTDFQTQVWNDLLLIPYGKTITYREQAKRLGGVEKIRATASANGKNPIVIIIPCHRVIGSDGSLTGYGGGLWRKEKLLMLEKGMLQQELF